MEVKTTFQPDEYITIGANDAIDTVASTTDGLTFTPLQPLLTGLHLPCAVVLDPVAGDIFIAGGKAGGSVRTQSYRLDRFGRVLWSIEVIRTRDFLEVLSKGVGIKAQRDLK